MSNNRVPKEDVPMTDAEEGGDTGFNEETINKNTTATQETGGADENESAHQSQEATNTTGTQRSQQINISDEDDDGGYVNSDTEVKEVMKGMKNWTKTPPLPHDAEYFFPREPNTKRRIVKRAFRLRGMVAQALGNGTVQVVEEREGQEKRDLGDGEVVENNKDGK